MTREDFLEVIRKQYSERIHEAYIECEDSTGKLAYDKLQQKLTSLLKNARVEGLTTKDFYDLVESALPRDVYEGLRIKTAA